MNAVQAKALSRATERRALLTERPGGRTPAWWGMVLLIATEVTFFGVALASYFYVQFTSPGPWPQGGIAEPELVRPLVLTALLVASSAAMSLANRGIRHGRQSALLAGLALTWLLGTAFLAVQGLEYATKLSEFTWSANAYSSLFYAISGLHTAHIVVGWLMLGAIGVTAVRRRFTARRAEPVQLVALFWHTVTGLWVLMLFVLYLSPHL